MRKMYVLGLLTVVAGAFLSVPRASADYVKCVQYYKQGQFDKAIQECKADLDKNPDWESGHRLVGLCYLNLKNYALAIVELGRAVQLKSPAFVTYRGLALAYFNTDRLDNCIQTLNQGESLAKDPNDQYDLHHMRGSAYYRQQKFEQADDDLTAAIRIKSTDWVDYSQLGICYYNLNRFDEAAQALQKALSLKSGEAITTDFLGKTYFKLGVAALSAKQYSQALESLRKAASYAPGNGYVFYNVGEANLFLNNYADAEKAFNQASTLLPRNADVFQRLGLVYERQKKWDQSLASYQKANELSPSSAMKEAIARVTEMKKR